MNPRLAAAAALGAATAVTLAQPRWLVRGLARRFPDILFHVHTTRPLAALTIDDGPDARTTPALLDALARHGARATFFVHAAEARRTRHREVLRRLVAEGHELGNHLLRDEASIRLPRQEFTRQLLLADRILRDLGGAPCFFRPGSAWFGRAMLDAVAEHGYRCVLGSLYPFDAHHAVAAYSRALLTRRAGPGDIVVLHDRGARGRRTARVLDAALGPLRRRGLALRTLGELVPPAGAESRERTAERRC